MNRSWCWGGWGVGCKDTTNMLLFRRVHGLKKASIQSEKGTEQREPTAESGGGGGGNLGGRGEESG